MTNYYEQETLWNRDLSPEEKERLEIVKALLPSEVNTVLDVGCGGGTLSNYLPAHLDITGLDLSAEALKYFKHKKVLGNVANLPFGDRSFDLVICSDVLEHLRKEDFESAIRELKRVSRKYIVIISPNEEQLEYRQTQCGECRAIFHVHWHMRSLSMDIIRKYFEDQFDLYLYTYFGGNWVQQDPILAKAYHFEDQFQYFDKAICPMCGARQDYHSIQNRKTSSPLLSKYLQNELSLQKRTTPVEMLVLLKRRGMAALLDELKSHRLPGTLILHREQAESLSSICLAMRRRYEIYPASRINTLENTCFYPERGYVLVNPNMGWGEVTIIDKKAVRFYQNGQGQDKHAAFVMPAEDQYPQEILIDYFDLTDEEILLQIYDIEQGYITLGRLTNQKSNQWKTDCFVIPSKIHYHADHGFVFRLTTTMMNPKGSLPVWRIHLAYNSALCTTASTACEHVEATTVVSLQDGSIMDIYEATRKFTPPPPQAELVITVSGALRNAYWVDSRGRWVWLGHYKEIVVPQWAWWYNDLILPENKEFEAKQALKKLIDQREEWHSLRERLENQNMLWEKTIGFMQEQLQQQKELLLLWRQELSQQQEKQEQVDSQLRQELQQQKELLLLWRQELSQQQEKQEQVDSQLRQELQQQKELLLLWRQELSQQQEKQEQVDSQLRQELQQQKELLQRQEQRLRALEDMIIIQVIRWGRKKIEAIRQRLLAKI